VFNESFVSAKIKFPMKLFLPEEEINHTFLRTFQCFSVFFFSFHLSFASQELKLTTLVGKFLPIKID